MAPRLRVCRQCQHLLQHHHPHNSTRHLATATATITTTPAPPPLQMTTPPSLSRYPTTQPPSHKPPEFRKSQLHRQYTSLLRSSPLTLFFQHSNLTSNEWMSIRRELHHALETVDSTTTTTTDLARTIKIQTVQTGIFESALRIADHYSPSSTTTTRNPPTHSLSSRAHNLTSKKKYHSPLYPLLTSGPLAILSFPLLSPPHLKTALSVLSPEKPSFPPPTRRSSPGYWDPTTQAGLQKLLLLGARAEGRVFGGEGVRWVGGLGGVEALRAELVLLLEGVGGSVVGVLGQAQGGLVRGLEGLRGMLEERERGGEPGGKV